MKFLSVCSGIEAASCAWEPLGFTPVAFSEIEPFPCSVLAHRFPSVPNLGDMTNFEWNIEHWFSRHSCGRNSVSPSPSPVYVRTHRRSKSHSPIAEFCRSLSRDGLSGKRPRCSVIERRTGLWFHPRGDGRFRSMGSRTEFSTLNALEFPSDAVESSLLDVWNWRRAASSFEPSVAWGIWKGRKSGEQLPALLQTAFGTCGAERLGDRQDG